MRRIVGRAAVMVMLAFGLLAAAADAKAATIFSQMDGTALTGTQFSANTNSWIRGDDFTPTFDATLESMTWITSFGKAHNMADLVDLELDCVQCGTWMTVQFDLNLGDALHA